MKWAIPQLRKLAKPFSFEYEFDLILQEAENVQISFSDEEDLPEQTEADEYDLSEIDTTIFDDPELLLDYIEKISRHK